MKYTKEYLVNSYETDANLNLKLYSLFQWVTEIAWEHAKLLGAGFEELALSNRIWILSGISLQINKLPKWQDTIKLETWPSGINGLHYSREFKLYSSNGEVLASAGSTWVILDKTISKPVALQEFKYLGEITKEKAIDNLFSKIRPHKNLFPAFKEIAKHTDIDMHKHVNNAVYVRWIENCTGDIFPRRINTLKIQYLNEIKLNDEVVIFNEKTENHYYWEARINGDKLCFRAEVGLF